MVIFIPTRSRIHKQITRKKFFLDKVQQKYPVYYVVPEAELDLFTRVNGSEVRTLSVPDSFRLSNIRQWLVDTQRIPDPLHVCADDDLVFLRRKAPSDVHQRSNMTVEDAMACFERMEWWMTEQGYAHGAISQRGGNHTTEEEWFRTNGRACDMHFYNANIIYGEGLRFDDVVLRQDFHMTLSLLERGYPNVIDHEFMSGQSDGAPGGCQVYRTHEMLAEQAHRLAELHPGFVKVVEKERKGGFGVSTDVRISWAKAFRSKLDQRRLP